MNKTINISLPQTLANLANSQVKAGYYSSISELIRESLRDKLMPRPKLNAKMRELIIKAQDEYRQGKATPLTDIDDLDTL